MKEFAIYTGLRVALFAVCFAVLWFALNNWLTIFPLLLLALVSSSILSIFVLRAFRDRLAGVEPHASAARAWEGQVMTPVRREIATMPARSPVPTPSSSAWAPVWWGPGHERARPRWKRQR